MDKNGDGKVKPAKQRQRQKPQRKNLHRDGPDGQVRTLHLQYHLSSVESTPYPCWPHAVVLSQHLRTLKRHNFVLYAIIRWHRGSSHKQFFTSDLLFPWNSFKVKITVFIHYTHQVTSAEFTQAILDLWLVQFPKILYKVKITCIHHQVTSAEFTQAILGDDKFSRLLAVSVMQMFVWALQRIQIQIQTQK